MRTGKYHYVVSDKQKVALLLGYAITDLPIRTLASRAGVSMAFALSFLYTRMRCKDRRKRVWTAEDDAKIKQRMKKGRCKQEAELAEELGVSLSCLASRVKTLKRIGKI